MTTPPNAPEVDVLSVIDELINVPVIECIEDQQFIDKANRMRTAVAALLTREAALVAERDAESKFADDYRALLERAIAERDALAAEVVALREIVEEGRRAIGDHNAPHDCYATGPLTGDPILDLVQCPACSFIAMYDAARAEAGHGSPPVG